MSQIQGQTVFLSINFVLITRIQLWLDVDAVQCCTDQLKVQEGSVVQILTVKNTGNFQLRYLQYRSVEYRVQ